MATAIGTPAAISTAATTAAMAAVGPTDRSMPPAMMTSVMPSATQALIEDCWRMLRRLRSVRKFGLRTAKTTTIARRPNSVPASRRPKFRRTVDGWCGRSGGAVGAGHGSGPRSGDEVEER